MPDAYSDSGKIEVSKTRLISISENIMLGGAVPFS